MLNSSKKVIKFIRFLDNKLYLKEDSKVTELGLITTRKGALTRVEKLKAVAASGEWIEI